MDFQDLLAYYVVGARRKGGAIVTPTNSFLLLGILTSVPILVKIDQEMRPWKCSKTDTHWQTDRRKPVL